MLVEEEVAVKRSVRSEASALERVAASHPAKIQRIATADQHPTHLPGAVSRWNTRGGYRTT